MRDEKYGTRSLVYSKWHRFYLGDLEPMIDLDGIEWCPEKGCSKPLVLIETARDVGQANKPTTVLRQLADMSKVLALCVLYRVSETANSATGCACEPRKRITACDHGISRFRVRRVWPPPPKGGHRHWKVMTPEEFRDRLREVRMAHIDTEHRLWDGDAA
ncbi:MAG TPA: hypothetical protein VHY21_25465 [Pseudonocardiaceae bacterium]|jgi:hypothetical protein|nr:hypothetical protein [Pseudonocardiaceae bacterium]